MGPNGARRIFSNNLDLADILGRTDLDFESFYFLDFLGPKFRAWAQLGPTHLGPAWGSASLASDNHAEAYALFFLKAAQGASV